MSGSPHVNEREAKMTDESPYDIELTHVLNAPPNRVYRAFTVPAEFAQWYGPVGFPARRDTVQLDPRVGVVQRFAMVSEADPSMRTAFDGRFTEVVDNQLLVSSGSWDGIPGQKERWESHLRVEFYDEEDGKTRVVLREGPHPAGTADLGRQAWEMMFAKLDKLLPGQR
jgi:uncharacterized protein YndB with AHSA1/START domain